MTELYKNIILQLEKDPFKINESDMRKLSSDELAKLLEELEQLESVYNNDQYSKKIQINSLYGALGNAYFPLFDVRMAASVTAYGRHYIRDIGDSVNRLLIKHYDYSNFDKSEEYPNGSALIYTHTDSTYFQMKPVIDKDFNTWKEKNPNMDFVDFLLEYGNKYLKETDRVFKKISTIMNTKDPSVLNMEFENIGDKGIFLKKARYFVRAHYSKNRLSKPKPKITGMEIIKSSTPGFSKIAIKKGLDILLDNGKDEILDFIKEYKNKFIEANIDEIAFPKSVSEFDLFVITDQKMKAIFEYLNSYKKEIGKILKNDPLCKNIAYAKFKDIIRLFNEEELEMHEIQRIIESMAKSEPNIKYNISTEQEEQIFNLYNNFYDLIIKTLISNKDISEDLNELFYMGEEVRKGTPIHVIAAFAHNKYIKDNNLGLHEIYSGDKIKFLYLKPNNPFDTHVIGYKDTDFLKAINLKPYIDYDKQYEKAFLYPLREMTNVLGIDYMEAFTRNKNFQELLDQLYV